MKNNIKTILGGVLVLFSMGITSCDDYLEKTPDAVISGEEAFKNFTNFQGFTEELYYCIPETHKYFWQTSFNWGEDEIMANGYPEFPVVTFDNGDFWSWQKENYPREGVTWLDGNTSTMNDLRDKKLWPLAWYGIHKANLGLANLNKLLDATDEERQLIEGQLRFFRGWFYFSLMSYFGGLPYIDRELPVDQPFKEPRLSYRETALKAAEDFKAAVNLLPVDWDDTQAGQATATKNHNRINKIMALGYLGKNYLYAGSPLMNYESTGNKAYDPELCKLAAEAFAELLALCESGEANYSLMPFSNYSDIFYSWDKGVVIPGGTEAIFQSPPYDLGSTLWGMNRQYSPKPIIEEGAGHTFAPTANYVTYYGMANGLPIPDATKADAESGYDPNDPWTGRDPRFYHDIIHDGEKVVIGTMGATQAEKDQNEKYRYAGLYTGGEYRDENSGSRTGYLNKKFIPAGTNRWDGYHFRSHFLHLSFMRLADVYLMYAEATLQGYGSATSKAQYSNFGFSKTAADAVNAVRDRAGVGHVANKFLGGKEAFMGEIIRERAVELAFETHRFNDLRRWLLLDKYPYNIKTAHEFDRVGTVGTATKVKNLRVKTLLERKYSEKHYWLPLKVKDVSMYPEFKQNPGW